MSYHVWLLGGVVCFCFDKGRKRKFPSVFKCSYCLSIGQAQSDFVHISSMAVSTLRVICIRNTVGRDAAGPRVRKILELTQIFFSTATCLLLSL